jgi:hypothetical protein
MIKGLPSRNLTHHMWVGSSIEYYSEIIAFSCGSANTKGAWTQVLTLDSDAEQISINFNQVSPAVAAQFNSMIVDIAVGGTGSETIIIPDLICGNAGTRFQGGVDYFFPLHIDSGSILSIRGQRTKVGSWQVQQAQINLAGASSNKAAGLPTGSHVVVINSSSTLASSTWATSIPIQQTTFAGWTLIGRAPKPLIYLDFGIQTQDTNVATYYFCVNIAAGDESDFNILSRGMWVRHITGGEEIQKPTYRVYCDINSGQNLYARASTDGAVGETLYNMALYGVVK